MNYLSLTFLGFLMVFFAVYYVVPSKFRYIAIFVGSYIFYGIGHPTMLITLVGLTLISYVGALIIEKKH